MLIERNDSNDTFETTVWLNHDINNDKGAIRYKPWKRLTLGFKISSEHVEFHPTNKDYMLARGVDENDDHSLYLTPDGGMSWQHVVMVCWHNGPKMNLNFYFQLDVKLLEFSC